MAEWKPRRMLKASKYKTGDWKRKYSPTRGDYLEMGDEVVIVNRGGTQMKVIKTLAHHIEPILLGHLDDKGVDLLDEMLVNDTIDETVEFFEDYKPVGPTGLRLKKRAEDGSEQDVEIEMEIDTSSEEYSSDFEGESEDNDEDIEEVDKSAEVNARKQKKTKEPKQKKDPSDQTEKEEFSLEDKDYQKIPYMHPKTKTCSFEYFFSKVDNISQKKELVEEQTLDVMEFRMGGSYKTDIVDLRNQQQNREDIEEHFLKIDAEEEKERQMQKKIDAMKKKTKEVTMTRSAVRNFWGMGLSYTISPSEGLFLVLENVEEESPACKAGLQAGDTIVTINGWAITLMHEVEVVLHILQACAFHTTLGVIRENDQTKNFKSIGLF